MERHTLRRRLFAASVASLAAAIVVPAPAFACSAETHAKSCCCRQDDAPLSPPADCLTKTCGCSRPTAPQNTPSERPTLTKTSDAISTDAPAFHGGTELAAPQLGASSISPVAAIPHRILHCSWLI